MTKCPMNRPNKDALGRATHPPCAACHRAGAVAEQREEYLVQQLKLYASGEGGTTSTRECD